jgi:hypothetical protein
MLRALIASCLMLAVPMSLSSSEPKGTVREILEEFSYDSHPDRLAAREFIIKARYESGDAPLEDRRIREIISCAELSIRKVNERTRLQSWYRHSTLKFNEVLEIIATETKYKNEVGQANWEKVPNFGYMQVQELTALNALWDLEIKTLDGQRVPGSNSAYLKNKKFQTVLKARLLDPATNILLGSWVYAKMKNLVRGDRRAALACYNMGRRSYLDRLKRDPASKGLCAITITHLDRWDRWTRIWKQLRQKFEPKVEKAPQKSIS